METRDLINDLNFFLKIGAHRNADIALHSLASSQDKEGSQLFVAFPFPKVLRSQLSHIMDLEDDLHITVLYAKDQIFTEKDRECAIAALEAVTRKYGPMKCKIQGIGMMGKDNSMVVNINIDRGAEFYVDLLREMEDRLGSINRAYDFIPHMTLRYKLPDPGVVMIEDLKKIQWTQNEVLINFSRQGKQKRMRLKG